MIEQRIHYLPIHGTVLLKTKDVKGRNWIKGDPTDGVGPIDLKDIPTYPIGLGGAYIECLNYDVDNEVCECRVRCETGLHEWIENILENDYKDGKTAIEYLRDDPDNLGFGDYYKLKRKDLE